MLIDTKGRAFDPKRLPKGRKQREVKLAELREVDVIRPKHGTMFNLGERGRLLEKLKTK